MKLRTQLLAGSAVVLLLMILIAAISYQNGRAMLTSQDWIRHRQDLVAVGYDVQSNVVGMQSAKRSYLLSGDEQQLQRFDGRRWAYATGIAGLKASLGDDPAQAGRVIEIASLVEDWLRAAGVEIAARRQVVRGKADMGAVVRQFAEDTANLSLFNAIDERIDALIAAERAALEARNLQVAKDKRQIVLEDVPDGYLRTTSGLGEQLPPCICVTPFSHEGRVQGVIELGTLRGLSAAQRNYLRQVAPMLAVAAESAHARARLARALHASQQLTDELQFQQEELRVANEEFEEQTQRLRGVRGKAQGPARGAARQQ